jgi:hypothetical protein
MSSVLVALLFGAGAGVWVYTKLAPRAGAGNQSSALIGGAIAGLALFAFFYTLLHFILNIG